MRSETSAVVIVMPADGPSFGIAPAGTWTWRSEVSQKSGAISSPVVCERTHESAACADSFMTSPSWPVSVSEPLPFIRVASMKRMSPPAGVQASPTATPGTRVRSSNSSYSNFGTPRNEVTTSGVTRTGSARPSAYRRSTMRFWPST